MQVEEEKRRAEEVAFVCPVRLGPSPTKAHSHLGPFPLRPVPTYARSGFQVASAALSELEARSREVQRERLAKQRLEAIAMRHRCAPLTTAAVRLAHAPRARSEPIGT